MASPPKKTKRYTLLRTLLPLVLLEIWTHTDRVWSITYNMFTPARASHLAEASTAVPLIEYLLQKAGVCKKTDPLYIFANRYIFIVWLRLRLFPALHHL